jgi:hypothetical protein
MRIVAQGLYDKSFVQDAFKDFYAAVHPWMKNKVAQDDKSMVRAIEKEAERGPIAFAPVQTNVLQKAAERFTAPDEFRKKLNAAAAKRKGRK